MCNYNGNNIDVPYICIPQYCPYFAARFQCPYTSFYYEEAERFLRAPQGPPKSPPPSFTPQQTKAPEASLMAVDPGAIRPCVYRFSYLWLRNGQSFWAYLVYVGRTSASGWRYRKGRWQYFGVDLKEIKSFNCY